jgi:hypothetical protein
MKKVIVIQTPVHMQATTAEIDHQPPEFTRLPPAGQRCPICSLSRTTLCELIAAGKIKAVKLRKKGALRGIVLINRASLLEYLHSLEQ